MLPRLVSVQAMPIEAAQAATVTEARSLPAAVVIANLRAEVLLRLVETMLRHIQRADGQDSPGNRLVEALLEAIRSLPAPAGPRAGRDLADILLRLPPAMRPAVENLLQKTISALPTRAIVDIIRNPEGPAARMLAASTLLLAAEDGDMTAQRQAARHPFIPDARLSAMLNAADPSDGQSRPSGDARALQQELRRLFEPNAARHLKAGLSNAHGNAATATMARSGNAVAESRPMPPRAGSEDARSLRRSPAFDAAAASQGRAPWSASRSDGNALPNRLPAMADQGVANPAGGRPDVKADSQLIRAEESRRPAVDAGDNQPGPASRSRGIPPIAILLQSADAGEPAQAIRALSSIIANLTPEETNVLRTLLDRADIRTAPAPAGTIETAMMPTDDGTDQATRTSVLQTTSSAESELPISAEGRENEAAGASTPSGARDALQADSRPEPLTPVFTQRDAIAPVFIPYAAAPDTESESEVAEPDDRNGEDRDDEEASSREGEAEGDRPGDDASAVMDGEDDASTDEGEELPDPGFMVYQRLGDYSA